jgi:hypothetical protein
MTVTARSFAIEFGRVAWRLVLYFGLLIGAFWLFSIGYSWAMHALGVQFARGPALWRAYRPRAGAPAEVRNGSGPAQGSAGPHVKAI